MTKDEAIEVIEETIDDLANGRKLDCVPIRVSALELAIESLSEPKIIRCKDCKWSDWYTAGDGKKYCYCMETGVGGRTENDYCSYAEREKEE